MAEKRSTVKITVDLGCSLCSRKIKKALCKLEKQFKIQAIVFDDENNTILVIGPFNPDCFIKKICCLAHKVIKDIQVQPDPPPKPDPKPPAPDPKPKPPPADPKPDPKPPPADPKPKPPPADPKPDPKPPPADPKPKPPPADPKPDPKPPPPQPPEVVIKFPMWPIPTPIWPVCCHQPCPCFEPRQGCCRCCSCGRVSDAPSQPPAPPPIYYGSSSCCDCESGGYKIVYEDEPAYGCSIM